MHLDPLLPRLLSAALVLLLMGLALRRLRQPLVVVYLLAGVALGPAGARVFTDEVALARIGDFGVVLLLFFVGMEVSLPRLLAAWRVSLVGTVLQVAASVGCVLAVGSLWDWDLPRVLLVGFAVSLSSTAVVILCFGLAALTGVLGLSTAVGAFFAGVVVGAARETDWVHRSLEPFRVVLVALFFVSVGMLIDPKFLLQNWRLMAGLVAAVLLTNWLINAVILRVLGRSWRRSLLVAAFLAQVGEFSFVLAAVGRENGIIEDFAYQVTVGLIAITLLLSPIVVWAAGRLVGAGGQPPAEPGRAQPGPA